MNGVALLIVLDLDEKCEFLVHGPPGHFGLINWFRPPAAVVKLREAAREEMLEILIVPDAKKRLMGLGILVVSGLLWIAITYL